MRLRKWLWPFSELGMIFFLSISRAGVHQDRHLSKFYISIILRPDLTVSTFVSTCVQHWTVVEHCSNCDICWKRVESNLNRFKLSFNIDSTFPLLSKMLNGFEAVWTLRSTLVQHLSNIHSTFVERVLLKCWNRLNGPFKTVTRGITHRYKLRTMGKHGIRSVSSGNFNYEAISDFIIVKSAS